MGFLLDAAAPSSAVILCIWYKVCINIMNWMVKRNQFSRLTPVEERCSHLQTIRNAPFRLSTAMFFVPCCLSLRKVVVLGGEGWGTTFPKKKKKNSQGISKYALPRLAKKKKKKSQLTNYNDGMLL